MAYITEMGTDADDIIIGTNGNEYSLNGFGGKDTLIGADGNDTLHGGEGDDTLTGGAGDDLFIYAGGETPVGDTLDGGEGFDMMFLATQAGTNTSVLLDDALLTNIEQVSGMDGNETFNGWALTKDITLNGQGGDDYLSGGAGNDLLLGGAGRDLLRGLGGNDTLVGGDADDVFVFNDAGGTWTVADFTQGVDHIWIDSMVSRDFAYVMGHAVQVGDDTQITMDGSTLIIKNIGVADLRATDFFF